MWLPVMGGYQGSGLLEKPANTCLDYPHSQTLALTRSLDRRTSCVLETLSRFPFRPGPLLSYCPKHLLTPSALGHEYPFPRHHLLQEATTGLLFRLPWGPGSLVTHLPSPHTLLDPCLTRTLSSTGPGAL